MKKFFLKAVVKLRMVFNQKNFHLNFKLNRDIIGLQCLNIDNSLPNIFI